MKKNLLKAIPALVITGMLASGLMGCGEETDTNSTAASTTVAGDESATSVMQLANISEYVEVSDYMNMDIHLNSSYVADPEMVNQYSTYYYSYSAKSVSEEHFIYDRAVEDGDMIHLDYVGYKDEIEFEGGSTGGAGTTLFIGSDSYIDGFEDGLIGVMPGETVDLNLTFPEDYGTAELAGADVVFTVTVNAIIPENAIVEAWISEDPSRSGSTYADVVAYYENYLTETAESSYDSDFENALAQELLNRAVFKKEFPGGVILTYQQNASDILEYYASIYGTDANTFATYMLGMTADDYIQNSSYDQLKLAAVCRYIAEAEGMTLTHDELTNRILDYLRSLGYSESEVIEQLATVDYDEFEIQFMEDDVFEYVAATCNVTTLDD